jgi:hypothetical protein
MTRHDRLAEFGPPRTAPTPPPGPLSALRRGGAAIASCRSAAGTDEGGLETRPYSRVAERGRHDGLLARTCRTVREDLRPAERSAAS